MLVHVAVVAPTCGWSQSCRAEVQGCLPAPVQPGRASESRGNCPCHKFNCWSVRRYSSAPPVNFLPPSSYRGKQRCLVVEGRL